MYFSDSVNQISFFFVNSIFEILIVPGKVGLSCTLAVASGEQQAGQAGRQVAGKYIPPFLQITQPIPFLVGPCTFAKRFWGLKRIERGEMRPLKRRRRPKFSKLSPFLCTLCCRFSSNVCLSVCSIWEISKDISNLGPRF